MECVIRRAEESDMEAIRDLWQEINDYHAEGMPQVFRQHETVTTEQLHEWLGRPDNAFFVAARAGEVVGFVQCITRQSADTPLFVKRTYMVVEVLVVRSACRRQGIGRLLMERAHAWARELGIDQIEIGVWEFNANARRLYESMGYQTVSRKLWVKLPKPSHSRRSP